MTHEASFDELMTRLRSGDESVATEVFHRFARRLIGLARRKLDLLPAAKVDPESVVQSAFRSFFVRNAEGQFDLDDWGSLWSLLAQITLRKCGHKIEYFHADRRNFQREAAPPTVSAGSDDSIHACEAIARDPTPDEAAILSETVEQMLQGLKERERDIVLLKLQGFSMIEISEKVECSERTVERVLKRIRERLARTGTEQQGG
jgi:RNA polymerase sigma-70 factor (ECF subfamily)